MTPKERNEVYEILMLIDTGLSLIVKRALALQKTCQDIKSDFNDVKAAGLKRSREILEMAATIEKRKKPIFTMIEIQRKEMEADFRPDEMGG